MAIFTHKHDHRRGANAIENHHTYTGAYMDDETGLYYLSSRYYDPKTGSFTSADSYAERARVIGSCMPTARAIR